MSELNGTAEPPKTRFRWSINAQFSLLRLWKKYACALRAYKFQAVVHAAMAEEISAGAFKVTPDQIRIKMQTLRRRYRKEVKKCGRIDDFRSTWIFFNKVHNLLCSEYGMLPVEDNEDIEDLEYQNSDNSSSRIINEGVQSLH